MGRNASDFMVVKPRSLHLKATLLIHLVPQGLARCLHRMLLQGVVSLSHWQSPDCLIHKLCSTFREQKRSAAKIQAVS